MRAQTLGVAIAIAISLLTACAPTFANDQIEKAKARCATDGKFLSGRPFVSEGLFAGFPEDGFVFSQAAYQILVRRFRFVEYQRKTTAEDGRSGDQFFNQFFENMLGTEGGEKYVRIFAARSDDLRCAPFKRYVTSYPNVVAHQLRWWGLPPGMCLAIERTNELRSTVEKIHLGEKRLAHLETGEWGEWIQYQERVSKSVLGKVWTGGYRSSAGSFSCQNKPEQEKLDQLVTSSGNPDLPLPSAIVEITNPTFPSRRIAKVISVGPEIPAGEPPIAQLKRNFTYENWQVAGELIDNGNTFQQPYYDQGTILTGAPGTLRSAFSQVSLAGFRIHLIRPGLRRRIPVADGDVTFGDCGRLDRLNGNITIMCRGVDSGSLAAQWGWMNLLLIFEDDGNPKEKIAFRFEGSSLPERTFMTIFDVEFIGPDRLKSKANFWREVSGKRVYYQAEVVFQLKKEGS